MKYTVEIRPLATIEIIDAYNWYELQKEGLGLEFLEALQMFNDHLLSNPHTHSFYEGTVRHGKLHKFPYSVVYEVFNNAIVIYSVFMTRQDPTKKRTK